MRKLLIILAPVAMVALSSPVSADVQGSAKAALSAQSVAARDAALGELEAAGDPLAAYVAGSVEFFVALERLGQGLHRHGFESPRSFMVPLMQLPIPANPNPEPLTYEQFRIILTDFRDGMSRSARTLGTVPAGADIGIEVDLARLGIDINADGNIAPDESALAIMAALAASSGAQPPEAAGQGLVFRFDRADG